MAQRGRKQITESVVVQGAGVAGLAIPVAHDLPNTPAAEVVNGAAGRVLDILPLEDGHADDAGEVVEVEDLTKGDSASVAANVHGDKVADNGDALCDEHEVDQVALCTWGGLHWGSHIVHRYVEPD